MKTTIDNEIKDLKAYFSEEKEDDGKLHKHFCYVAIDCKINSLKLIFKNNEYKELATEGLIHLTTDSAYDYYISHRKETPKKVIILDSFKMVKVVLDTYGYFL